MNKYLITFLSSFTVVAVTMAGPFTVIQISESNASITDAKDTNSYPNRVTGTIRKIIIDQSGTSTNCNVNLYTTTGGALAFSRTLFNNDNSTALVDFDVNPMELGHLASTAVTTNLYVPMILFNDKVEMTTWRAAATNVNVKAWIIIEED